MACSRATGTRRAASQRALAASSVPPTRRKPQRRFVSSAQHPRIPPSGVLSREDPKSLWFPTRSGTEEAAKALCEAAGRCQCLEHAISLAGNPVVGAIYLPSKTQPDKKEDQPAVHKRQTSNGIASQSGAVKGEPGSRPGASRGVGAPKLRARRTAGRHTRRQSRPARGGTVRARRGQQDGRRPRASLPYCLPLTDGGVLQVFLLPKSCVHIRRVR